MLNINWVEIGQKHIDMKDQVGLVIVGFTIGVILMAIVCAAYQDIIERNHRTELVDN